jgi:hypothetical protein
MELKLGYRSQDKCLIYIYIYINIYITQVCVEFQFSLNSLFHLLDYKRMGDSTTPLTTSTLPCLLTCPYPYSLFLVDHVCWMFSSTSPRNLLNLFLVGPVLCPSNDSANHPSLFNRDDYFLGGRSPILPPNQNCFTVLLFCLF